MFFSSKFNEFRNECRRFISSFFFSRSLMSKPYNFYTWHTPNMAGRQLLHLIKYSNQFGLPFRVQTRVRSSRTTFFSFRSVEIISSSSRSTNGREANFLHVHRSRGYCRVFTETQRSNCSQSISDFVRFRLHSLPRVAISTEEFAGRSQTCDPVRFRGEQWVTVRGNRSPMAIHLAY